MTRLRRLLRWASPYRELLVGERRRSATLRAGVAERDATIKALRIDLAVEHARTKLAKTQRDRARDLAGALMGEPEWTAEDEAFLRSLGERPA